MKTQNWKKVFYNMFYRKLDIPNKVRKSCLSAHACFVALLGYLLILKKEAATIFYFKINPLTAKNGKTEKNMKKIFFCILTLILSV